MTCEPDFERMRERLMQRVSRLNRRRHVTRRIGITAGIALAATATTGATFVVFASPFARAATATCYEQASTASYHTQTGLALRANQQPEDALVGNRVARALGLCETVWRFGILGTPDHEPDDTYSHPAPDLFACELRDGTLAVFPAQDAAVTCLDLGLTLPQA